MQLLAASYGENVVHCLASWCSVWQIGALSGKLVHLLANGSGRMMTDRLTKALCTQLARHCT